MSLPLVLLAACPAPLPPASPCLVTEQDERESLQEFLDRMRKKQEAVFASLRGRVDDLLSDIDEAIDNNSAKDLVKARRALIALGPEIAPMLVEEIDPGRAPDRKPRERSQNVSWALRELPTRAITDRLLEIAKRGSVQGQRNALGVLGRTSEPRRVSPPIVEIYNSHTGIVQLAALQAIAQIGGDQNDGVLRTALLGVDDDLRQAALDAIVKAGAPQFAQQVLILATNLEKSKDYVNKILAYYRACPDVVDKHHVAAMIEIAADARVDTIQRQATLELLPLWERQIDGKHKRRVKELTKSGRRSISTAALIFLATLGDSNARRDLMRQYDEAVERDEDNSRPYVDRATALYKIGEYSHSFRDCKQAIKLSRNGPQQVPDAFILAAKCNAQLGKLKLASEYLDDAPISIAALQALASDPVFAELRESGRYGGVFRLEEDE